jgi:hypothetical protein
LHKSWTSNDFFLGEKKLQKLFFDSNLEIGEFLVEFVAILSLSVANDDDKDDGVENEQRRDDKDW